jgi:hypothetical protein
MSTSESSTETGATTTTLDEANEAGYLGTAPDPEPNESYTVQGVVAADSSASASTGDTSAKSSSASSSSSKGTSSSKSAS